MAQDHLVIELAIDPALHDALDVAEVDDHVARVELLGADLDLGHRVVPVRMLADAVVVEQPVPVAEVDALGDRVHRLVMLKRFETDCSRSSPRVSTARCSPAARRAPARAPDLRQHRARVGSRGTLPRSTACWRRAPFRRRLEPLAQLDVHDARPLSRRRTGRCAASRRPSTRPDEDVYLTGRNVVLLSKAAIYCAQHRIGAHRARSARRQSVSRRDAGVLRGDGATRCRSVSRSRSRSSRRSRRWTRAR